MKRLIGVVRKLHLWCKNTSYLL